LAARVLCLNECMINTTCRPYRTARTFSSSVASGPWRVGHQPREQIELALPLESARRRAPTPTMHPLRITATASDSGAAPVPSISVPLTSASASAPSGVAAAAGWGLEVDRGETRVATGKGDGQWRGDSRRCASRINCLRRASPQAFGVGRNRSPESDSAQAKPQERCIHVSPSSFGAKESVQMLHAHRGR
jgi:hypothetical protein